MSYRLHVHTREVDTHHPATIAGAAHLTLAREDGEVVPLRNGAGVVYAPATVGGDGRMRPQILRDALLSRVGEHWTLTANICDAEGRMCDSRAVAYRSEDLITWEGPHPIDPANVAGGETIEVDEATALKLITRLGRIRSIAVEVDESGPLQDRAATVFYSDGSSRRARVAWGEPVAGRVIGSISVHEHPFPFIVDRADPHIYPNEGGWLFVATPDAGGGNQDTPALLIRAADTLEGLASADDHTIAAAGDAGLEGCFWAPELHEIGRQLRILFAPSIGTASWDGVQCHIMTLRDGGNPLDRVAWSVPEPVLTADGRPLRADHRFGISLDMTYLPGNEGGHYVWSQRVVDDGHVGDAELWIAGVDPSNAARLRDEPRRLHTGRYSWELTGASVVEGAFPLIRGDRIHLTYAAAAVGPHYATGLLSASTSDNPGDPAAWTAQPFPALDSASVPGQWGPGHVSFFEHDGDTMIALHAKADPDELSRHTGIRRVHWAQNGLPVLDMTPEEDVRPDLRAVFIVTGEPE